MLLERIPKCWSVFIAAKAIFRNNSAVIVKLVKLDEPKLVNKIFYLDDQSVKTEVEVGEVFKKFFDDISISTSKPLNSSLTAAELSRENIEVNHADIKFGTCQSKRHSQVFNWIKLIILLFMVFLTRKCIL